MGPLPVCPDWVEPGISYMTSSSHPWLGSCEDGGGERGGGVRREGAG